MNTIPLDHPLMLALFEEIESFDARPLSMVVSGHGYGGVRQVILVQQAPTVPGQTAIDHDSPGKPSELVCRIEFNSDVEFLMVFAYALSEAEFINIIPLYQGDVFGRVLTLLQRCYDASFINAGIGGHYDS